MVFYSVEEPLDKDSSTLNIQTSHIPQVLHKTFNIDTTFQHEPQLETFHMRERVSHFINILSIKCINAKSQWNILGKLIILRILRNAIAGFSLTKGK